MRTEEQMMTTILAVAEKDERIRAVIISGSRSNPNVEKDEFQDYDIVYIVKDLASFQNDTNWIDVFGERIILQMPNSMQLDELETQDDEIVYLMLFKDFNRIDLRLIETQHKDQCEDSLNNVLLDKDGLFGSTQEPSDRDYWVKSPTQKELTDCCNEFWWVSTYIIKGLARDEPLYAKAMLETPVRNMFMKILAWYVGAQNEFKIDTGSSNRFLEKYISPVLWTRILKTYPDAEVGNIWESLLEMTNLFHQLAQEVAAKTGLVYNLEEADNVHAYLLKIRKRIKGN